jgi:hypothetical protein
MRTLFILYCFTTFFLTAAAGHSHTASSVDMFGESPCIFSINGHRHDGLRVNGVIIYTNHGQSVKDILPDETRAFIAEKVPHLISEYNIFSSSIFETPYHSPADFVREGFIDFEFCLTNHPAFSEYAEAFESFFPGEYEDKPLWLMLHPGRVVSGYYEQFQYGFYNSQYETIEDAGIDTWLMDMWNDRKSSLHVLEDELDRDIAHRLDPDENFLGWRNTKIQEADLDFWARIFNFIVAEGLKPSYLKYKETIQKYLKGEKVTLNAPFLEYDGSSLMFTYEERTIELQTRLSTGYCADPAMVYRNGLWINRLDESILPKINGAPFIQAVGRQHQFVESLDGSRKLGIHDYFQANFESGCLKPITAAEIPKYLSN